MILCSISYFFFFNDTATTEIYTLSLHDALPISMGDTVQGVPRGDAWFGSPSSYYGGEVYIGYMNLMSVLDPADRKSTRLNSSHANISYAVFCLKKKKNELE